MPTSSSSASELKTLFLADGADELADAAGQIYGTFISANMTIRTAAKKPVKDGSDHDPPSVHRPHPGFERRQLALTTTLRTASAFAANEVPERLERGKYPKSRATALEGWGMDRHQ